MRNITHGMYQGRKPRNIEQASFKSLIREKIFIAWIHDCYSINIKTVWINIRTHGSYRNTPHAIGIFYHRHGTGKELSTELYIFGKWRHITERDFLVR